MKEILVRKIQKHQGSVGGKERKGHLVKILKKAGVLPEATENPTPQQPKHTKHKPGPSTSTEDIDPQPGSSQGTVTWPSNEKYWKQLLPHNYRKRFYFSCKRW